jgi:hypothetical protein
MSTTEPTTRSEQVDKVVEAAGKLITHEVAGMFICFFPIAQFFLLEKVFVLATLP